MPTAPSEYIDAYNKLITFRQKVWNELVAGRVKAILETNHETLSRYGIVIDDLSIVPQMFGNVKQKALALKLGNNDVGTGDIKQIKSTFAIGKADYPLSSPSSVPQRLLPQVDVFLYTPPTDLEMIEKTNEQTWANLFILQGDSKQFKEVADAENVFFDYYKFKPVGRCKVEIALSSPKPEFTEWTKITGEATILIRSVTPKDTTVVKDYDIYVLIDANYHSSLNEVGVVPLSILITDACAGNPACILIAGGKRLQTTDKGLFSQWVAESQVVGWTKTHDAYSITIQTVLWANISVFVLSVNDTMMGTTSPAPATYNKKSVDEVTVTAQPYTGYSVKNWELDGVQFPASDTFVIKMYRDHSLMCVFWAGNTLAFRPTADGDLTELFHEGSSHDWNAVSEEVSDGDVTFLYNWYGGTEKTSICQMADPAVPDTAIIDYVKVYARMRRYRRQGSIAGNIVIKTNGQIVNDAYHYMPTDENWHLYEKLWAVNPVTGNAWTKAEVLALQCGVRLQAFTPIIHPTDTGIRCTQVWGEVKYHMP